MKFGTKAIHAGVEPDPSTGAIMTPIFQTSTYVQESPAKHKGYAYARGANPTRNALQKSIAALENGKFGLCFSSGMGATDAVIKLLNPGDEVITSNDLYGGSYRMFTKVYERFGIKFHFIDLSDAKNAEAYVNSKTKLFWIETPSNPLMRIIDIEACVKIAKKNNCLVAVDNTFASPYLQNPLDLGADIVMHSVTKYLGGHSDIVGGSIAIKDQDLYAEKISYLQNAVGAIPSPFDCYLLTRSIKTLSVRMQKHNENGEKVANFLESHPKVIKIHYPGTDQKYKSIASKQMSGFGGMMSIVLDTNLEGVNTFLSHLKIFTLAESLGGVESLIEHPAIMTHASIDQKIRDSLGISDSLLRLSVGIEDVEDIIDDLNQALETI